MTGAPPDDKDQAKAAKKAEKAAKKQRRKANARMRRAVFSIVGILLVCTGLINFFQGALTGLPFVSTIQSLSEAYRDVTHALWEVAFFWLPFELPDWSKDALTIALGAWAFLTGYYSNGVQAVADKASGE